MIPKILIINANYYKDISRSLQVAAELTLERESKTKVKYETVIVPGIFEIPVAISKNIKKYDAFVVLGCVIKGETPHFDFISRTTFDAIMKLSVDYKKPIGNGIITALNITQANSRSGENDSDTNIPKTSLKGKSIKPNKGRESTRAVLTLLGILKNESK